MSSVLKSFKLDFNPLNFLYSWCRCSGVTGVSSCQHGRKFVLLLLISFVLSLIDMGKGTLPNYERIL